MTRDKEKRKSRERLRSTLSNDAYWQVNKKLARRFGNDAAIILSDLISKYDYHDDRGELTKSGEFFYTIEDMEKYTNVKKKAQTNALRKLKNAKMIEIDVRGLPASRYFKINHDVIDEWFATPEEDLPAKKEKEVKPMSEERKRQISEGLKRRNKVGAVPENRQSVPENQICGSRVVGNNNI